MIANIGNGPLDIAVILCDGSKGLGSVKAFQMVAHHGHGPVNHHDSLRSQATEHHGTQSGCADCDMTWASSLFDETVLDNPAPLRIWWQNTL
ncbi:MAG: hypothetical protein CMQ20_07880 [Gammaproteobacteria bacterium]|nr:hypothetical protein [Gammaproteobacteria bacterium]